MFLAGASLCGGCPAPLLPEGAPGIYADPVSFFFEGRVVEGRIGYSKENLKINKATMSYTESNNTVTLRNEKKNAQRDANTARWL